MVMSLTVLQIQSNVQQQQGVIVGKAQYKLFWEFNTDDGISGHHLNLLKRTQPQSNFNLNEAKGKLLIIIFNCYFKR